MHLLVASPHGFVARSTFCGSARKEPRRPQLGNIDRWNDILDLSLYTGGLDHESSVPSILHVQVFNLSPTFLAFIPDLNSCDQPMEHPSPRQFAATITRRFRRQAYEQSDLNLINRSSCLGLAGPLTVLTVPMGQLTRVRDGVDLRLGYHTSRYFQQGRPSLRPSLKRSWV